MKRYYDILGVGRDAPIDEVRQAYRDLVRVWHPDRFSSDYRLSKFSEEKLKLINEAYREVCAHIEKSPPLERGGPFPKEGSGTVRPPPGGDEYLFDFYDPGYSPWIWTYTRERGYGTAPERPPAARPFRFVLVAAGILLFVLAGGAAAWRFGLLAAYWPGAPPFPAAGAREGTVPPPPSSPGADLPKGHSRVTVVNDTPEDAAVKVVLAGAEGARRVRDLFLPAGSEGTAADLPPGRYLLKAALGRDWDPRAVRFRYPAGFAMSSDLELAEDAKERPQGEGIVALQVLATDLRVSLATVLGTRITEEGYLAD